MTREEKTIRLNELSRLENELKNNRDFEGLIDLHQKRELVVYLRCERQRAFS